MSSDVLSEIVGALPPPPVPNETTGPGDCVQDPLGSVTNTFALATAFAAGEVNVIVVSLAIVPVTLATDDVPTANGVPDTAVKRTVAFAPVGPNPVPVMVIALAVSGSPEGA